MIMPKYLFEFNGFRMNLVNLVKTNYSINDILGFRNSACDVTGSFTILPTRYGYEGRALLLLVLSKHEK